MGTHSKGKARFDAKELSAAIESFGADVEAAQAGATIRAGTVRVRRGEAVLRPVRGTGLVEVDPIVVAVQKAGAARILRTDRDALRKLEMKLASLEALYDNAMRTNEFLANDDRAGLLAYGYSAEGVEELFLCGPGQRPGYSAQELANMALNVERTRDRIVELTKGLQRPSRVEQGRGYEYREDASEQRVVFKFPDKPILTVRQLLGRSGFRWFAPKGVWSRPLSDNSIQAAERVRQTLDVVPDIFEPKRKNTLH